MVRPLKKTLFLSLSSLILIKTFHIFHISRQNPISAIDFYDIMFSDDVRFTTLCTFSDADADVNFILQHQSWEDPAYILKVGLGKIRKKRYGLNTTPPRNFCSLWFIRLKKKKKKCVCVASSWCEVTGIAKKISG